MSTQVASGMWAPTYESFACGKVTEDDVEHLVSMKASSYKIPGYTRDDIAQEIRMVAFKALTKYDAAKNHSTAFNFVARCVDNYLINLRRDNDAFLSKKKLAEADDATLNRLEQKRRVYYANSIGDEEYASVMNRDHECEVHETVLLVLPSGLHTSYWMLVKHGQHAIPKQHFTKIKKIILELYG